MSKKKLPWWPDSPNDDIDSFYMSIAELFFTYFISLCVFSGWVIDGSLWGRYVAFGILAIYFAHFWFSGWPESDLTRMEKIQTFVQQTLFALVFTSPLIFFFCNN